MMKTSLTREESAHLISLGVLKEKASIWNKDKTIFKLEDFLNGEILPKEIEIEQSDLKDWCNLNIQIDKSYAEVCYDTWTDMGEKACGSCWIGSPTFSDKELINALYQLTCWYYGEYLKSEKK